jgi:hypothetical protein
MDTTAENYQAWKYDCSLPPDWRARDGQRLVGGEEPEWSGTDPAIREYARYLRSERTGSAHNRRGSDWTAIEAAHQIAQQQDVQRWEIQGRVLANQAIGEIADCCDITPDTVGWFETLFFDVRCRLTAWAWVNNVVLGDCVCRGFDDGELGRLWMAFGFYGGIAVIDELVRAFRSVWEPGGPATIAVYFREHCPATLKLKATIAVHCIPLNQATALVFTKMHVAIRKIEMMLSPRKAAVAKKSLQEATIRLYQAAPWRDRKALSPSKQALVEQAMAGQGDLSLPDHSASVAGDRQHPPEPPQPVCSAV